MRMDHDSGNTARTAFVRHADTPARARVRIGAVMRVLVAVLVIALVVASGGWLWLSRTRTAYPGSHFNRGENAVWLEHSWAGEAHSAAQIDQLAAQLKREQVRFVYLHVGPLDSHGNIPVERYAYAQSFVASLKQRDAGIAVLAWIGQLERASGLPPDQTVDLTSADTREAIAATAAHFVSALGFDGVHYDIEPMINNSPHFLDLLDATRAALPSGAMLSISAPMWAPNAHIAEWLRAGLDKGASLWTTYYYATVAKHVDQIVVMMYNTAIPNGSLYGLFVKQETSHILSAVRSAHSPPQVLIALPTYHDNGFWFHDFAENLDTGLPGVVAGLNADRDTRPFVGVALYRYGTTSAADWHSYERLWLGG
jgi:glycosyl hydrolase family 18 (putative chitinase)